MADGSAIEWTSATWNPIAGCSVLSPGCTHCYAMKMAARIERMQAALGKPTPYAGLTQPSKAGPVWNGRIAVASDEVLTQPLRWKRPRRIFVNSMSDLFHEGVPDETIDKVFAVMALCPQHTFQVLTKRAQRMRAWFEERWQGTPAQCFKAGDIVVEIPAGGVTGRQHQVEIAVEALLEKFPAMRDTDNDALWTAEGNLKIRQYKWPLPNVWLGVSTEDQARADERIPHLLATPAAKRFISAEPLLGAIDIEQYICVFCKGSGWVEDQNWMPAYHTRPPMGRLPRDGMIPCADCNLGGTVEVTPSLGRLDWVIAGGESGPKARPSHPDWFRSLRDQCASAGVPFFFKQWGEWAPREEWSGHLGGGRFQTMLAIMRDGSQCPNDVVPQDVGAQRMALVGKKAAGATLDGKMHREFPNG